MKNQLVVIALILFGIMFMIPNRIFHVWIPVIDSLPTGLIGLALGGFGLYTVIKNRA